MLRSLCALPIFPLSRCLLFSARPLCFPAAAALTLRMIRRPTNTLFPPFAPRRPVFSRHAPDFALAQRHHYLPQGRTLSTCPYHHHLSAPSRGAVIITSACPARTPLDGYGTDSETDADVVGAGTGSNIDEYTWGPEDDAPLPPDSQLSEMGDDGFSFVEREAVGASQDNTDADDLPGLVDISGSESGGDDDEGSDDSDSGSTDDEDHPVSVNEATSSSIPVDALPQSPSRVTPKITSFFKVETTAEKVVRMEREAREYAEWAEESRLREANVLRMKAARKRADATERMQRLREHVRNEKIANGWTPGQKRKHVELVDYDKPKNNGPCGRKRKEKNKKKDSKLTNWFHPFIWPQVVTATSRAGRPWKPSDIVWEARKLNPGVFWKLTSQVVGRWIDKAAKKEGVSKWKDSVLHNVAWAKGNSLGGHSTRMGILVNGESCSAVYDTDHDSRKHPYPEIRKQINHQLTSLRDAGVALSLLTIRGLMVAHIQHGAPELFTRTIGSDGTKFRCSESFVHRYLRNTLGWSERWATKAAQKLPPNHEKILDNAFLREAYIIRDYAIPAALRVNTDQTQLVYQQGSSSTWTQRGAKQVATVGQEEKRAFTLVPSISASGKLLAMQSVFGSKTAASCPSPASKHYGEALELGYCMVPATTATYWSNHSTMHQLVDEVIAPYFEGVKTELGLPMTQVSIWKIDCWSVHKSREQGVFDRWISHTGQLP
ncbi:hypothetical protein B0H13DRAFT_2314298 [Mycena leptocephala]|nr:hypothetical protein B0H13DRAFT_2314298 [Mycena leptocephala]